MAGSNQLSDPATWVDTYGDYLYAFALSRVQDEPAAQDLVQETLTGALKTRAGFKGKASEKTWLTSILKYKIIDFIRKKYASPTVADINFDTTDINDEFDATGQWKTGPAQWAANPEELLAQKSFLEIVQKCLSQLPGKQAAAMSLRELEGESTQAICKVLNISATNCWVLLHRARFLMRKCIEMNWLTQGDTK